MSIIDMQYSTDGIFQGASDTPTQEAELRHQIRRMSAHPSIIVWSGCNECGGIGKLIDVVADEDQSRAIRVWLFPLFVVSPPRSLLHFVPLSCFHFGQFGQVVYFQVLYGEQGIQLLVHHTDASLFACTKAPPLWSHALCIHVGDGW
jgi:hypothetical protein